MKRITMTQNSCLLSCVIATKSKFKSRKFFLPALAALFTLAANSLHAASNNPPVAVNDAGTTFENTPVSINVLNNDTDADGSVDAATVDLDPSVSGIQASYAASQGSWSVSAAGPLPLPPVSTFNGVATRSYTVNDNEGAVSNTATISITVQGTACFSGLFQSLYYPSLNETDLKALNVNTSPFTYTVVKTYPGVVLNGTGYNIKNGLIYGVNIANFHVISISPGTYTYTDYGIGGVYGNVGDCDTSGNYYFTTNATSTVYKLNTNVTPLTITSAPLSSVWDPVDWAFDPATKKFYGANGNILYTFNPADNTVNRNTITGTIGTGGYGAAWWGGNGALYLSENATGKIYRVTVAAFSSIYAGQGEVTFNNDGFACPVATVITNFPPVAGNDVSAAARNSSVSVNVLSNDIDPDGAIDSSSVDLDNSTSGIQNTYADSHGSWTVNSSGVVTYSPASNFTGSSSVTYKVNDTNGATSNGASVSITVTYPPVANADSVLTTVNTPASVTVTANDTDPDGTVNAGTVDLDPGTAGRQTSFSNSSGNWSVNSSGKVSYTPATGFYGIASISYTVNDNNGVSSNTATVSITVTQAPVANNDTATTNEDTPVIFSVTNNDTDDGAVDITTVDLNPGTAGQQLTYSNAQGNWSADNSGNVTYTPEPDYYGSTGISYTVKDNNGILSNTGQITVSVLSVDDPAVANNDTATTDENVPVTTNIISNDTDIDGTVDASTVDLDPATPGIQTTYTSSYGIFTVDNAGNVTYTPAHNFIGSATLSYTVNDNEGATSGVGTFSITVEDPTICTLTASSVQNTFILCNGGTATVTVSASKGKAPYTGTGTFTVGAGTYTYTVTDARNCTATTTITVGEPAKLTATATPSGAILCDGTPATVTVSANGGTLPYSGPGIYTISSPGVYNYTVTDANGCTASTTATITQDFHYVITVDTVANATISPSGDVSVCPGSSLTVSITPEAGYDVDDIEIDGVSQGPSRSYTFTNISASSRMRVIMKTVRCIPPVLSGIVQNSSCAVNDGSVDLTLTGGTGPFTYSWIKAGNGFYASTEDLSNLGRGTYTVTVTANGGCRSKASYRVIQPYAVTWYLDADNDGYYIGNGIYSCTSPGPGYRSVNIIGPGDCDDNDRNKWQTGILYIDADNDNYDAGTASVCYGYSAPPGYSFFSYGPDCNDNNRFVNASYTYYRDADGDGLGDPFSSIYVCSSRPPAGYVTNNWDCSDADRQNLGPRTPGRITGSRRHVCDSIITYSIKSVKGATGYTWTVPPGSYIMEYHDTSVVVNHTSLVYSGIITVSAYNNCGQSSGISSLPIDSKPLRPVISGPACISSDATGLTYTAMYDPDIVNYVWTAAVPVQITSGQGTRTVTVNWNKGASGILRTDAYNACGNHTRDSIYVNINCTSGSALKSNNSALGINNFRVYPNPAGSVANIIFSSASAGKYTITISDNSGKQLLAKTGNTIAGSNKEQLNVEGLAAGNYIVTLTTNDGKQNIKLIKAE